MLRLVINHQRLRLSWWNVLDLNQCKTGYEPVALTAVLTFHMAEQVGFEPTRRDKPPYVLKGIPPLRYQ